MDLNQDLIGETWGRREDERKATLVAWGWRTEVSSTVGKHEVLPGLFSLSNKSLKLLSEEHQILASQEDLLQLEGNKK